MDKKRVIQSVVVFLFFTMFSIIVNFVSTALGYDWIWCFHISQKVSNGIPLYSEIGTVVAPIFFWIGALFIKIFGNYIFAMKIYAGIVIGGIATALFNIIKETLKKENEYALYVFWFAMMIYATTLSLTSYNSLAILFVLIALFFEVRREKKKDKNDLTKQKENKYNLLTGIFLGIAFFTKQNIGTYGVIATGVYSLIYKGFIKKEKVFKEIIIKASGFLSVLFLILLHFLSNGTFNSFMNFCFGGLLEFGDKNLMFGIPSTYCWMITFLVVLFGCMKLRTDDNAIVWLEVIYMAFMMFLIYPLSNHYHAMFGIILIIPLFVLLLNKIYDLGVMRNIITVAFLVFVRSLASVAKGDMTKTEVRIMGEDSAFLTFAAVAFLLILVSFAFSMIINNRKIMKWMIVVSCTGLILVGGYEYYLKINSSNVLPENMNIYKACLMTQESLDYINDVIEYILKKEDEGYNVYVVSADASYYMAALGRNQYKYDLNLYGSLGYDGEKVLIEETKKLENALILKDENVMFQEPVKFDEFIKENYKEVDKVRSLVVYSVEE